MMEIIKTESVSSDEPKNEPIEAVAFVNKNRDFFDHYAKGAIEIEPAPPGMNTFAFNLENNTIYISPKFYSQLGFSEEKTVFATLHEVEHFLEKIQILSEEGGGKKFENLLKRIKASRAYSLMDNCIADIRENRSVIEKTNIGMGELEQKTYQEDLFPDNDFTQQPRHIQFCQALLREARLPDEKCLVAPEVRQSLDEIEKVAGLMDTMTHPSLSMSMRLKLQDKYILPKMEALLEKDIEGKKKQKEQEKNDNSAEGTSSSADQDGENESDKNKNNQGESDPNIIFTDDYSEIEKKFPEAIPLEEIEKEFEKWKKAQSEKSSADRFDEEYAQKIGVEKAYLQKYRKTVQEINKINNPETNQNVIEELRNLFYRIISKRQKKVQAPKYPVEEGDELVDPAQLIADVKSGNLQPRVWEDTEIKEKKGDRFGEVEITLVCDRSSSMAEGRKAVEQQRSVVLMMEVLKEFAEICEAEKINIDQPLQIKSEVYSFASSTEDKTPLKKMSDDLGEAERINIYKKLHDLPGSTTDFNCLEAIDINLDENSKNKIKIGELKKIVIVFTDGGSDNPAQVQGVLKNLRNNGVIAIGVGITEAGQPVVTTYAPNALVVKDVSKLPLVLAELLKQHLKDL